jgi:hypothetical protein
MAQFGSSNGALTVTDAATSRSNLGLTNVAIQNVTQHDILVGGASNAITSVPPSATSGVPVISQGAAADPTFGTAVVAGGGTGLTSLTAHDVLVGNGTSAVTLVAPSATTGIPLVSNGAAADPSYSTAVVAGGGTGLTSLTAHDLLIGNGTSAVTLLAPSATSGAVLQSAGAGADPAYSTASYPVTTTVNQILYSSATNTVSGLATANRGVLTTGTTGVPVVTAIAADGQIIVGSTAGAPAAATLTAGGGISITNASNSITVTNTGASGGGLVWTDVTGASLTIVAGNGYLADRGLGVAFTLPASGTIGDVFRIVGVQGSWTLAQNANQQIKFGSSATTSGVTGSLASTNAGDCVECVATNTSASTIWRVMSSVGNITVA